MAEKTTSSGSADDAAGFDLLAAIDVRAGRVVRLQQGDFERERVYGDDVLATARAFRRAGAGWLHLVDLDGARDGVRRIDPPVLRALAAEVATDVGPLRVEIGGGLRSLDDVADVLDAGCARAVLGTSAIGDAAFVPAAIARFGAERIVVALDVRGGEAVGEGWRDGAAGVGLGQVLPRLSAVGVTTLVVTAIDRDGLLDGPDLALLESIAGATDARVIASGGIRSLGDLDAVRAIGCAGAIVGRALYEGTIDLATAIEHVTRGLPAGG